MLHLPSFERIHFFNLLRIKLILFLGKTKTAVTIDIPKFPAHFTGTGDLFASLLLAWMTKSNNDIKTSIENTIASMQAVLKRTIEYSKGRNEIL